MITVASTEFTANFPHYRKLVQREPVAVTSRQQVTGYFLSALEYQRYIELQSMASKAYAIDELSRHEVDAIASTEMDSRHQGLDALLDE